VCCCGVEPVEDLHAGVHRCACGVRQRAGLAHDDALVMEVQPRGVLEGQTADARTGADHDGHPGAQVTASVAAERLRGIGGADDEDHVHTVQRLGDVGGDRRQRDEALKLALGLDPAALADRHQMVLMGMLCVQRDLMPLTRPLVGDREPTTAGPQHRDLHAADSLRAHACSVVNPTVSHSGCATVERHRPLRRGQGLQEVEAPSARGPSGGAERGSGAWVRGEPGGYRVAPAPISMPRCGVPMAQPRRNRARLPSTSSDYRHDCWARPRPRCPGVGRSVDLLQGEILSG
jgi:hypothetical protein